MQSNDVEIWGHIEGLPEYYQISTLGNIRSLSHETTYFSRWGKEVRSVFKERQIKPGSVVTINNVAFKLDEAERQLGLRSAAVHDSIVYERPTTAGLTFELVAEGE